MPTSRKRVKPGEIKRAKNVVARVKYKRKFFRVTRTRPETRVFGIILVKELFKAPKKDRYILIGLVFWELRIGSFWTI